MSKAKTRKWEQEFRLYRDERDINADVEHPAIFDTERH